MLYLPSEPVCECGGRGARRVEATAGGECDDDSLQPQVPRRVLAVVDGGQAGVPCLSVPHTLVVIFLIYKQPQRKCYKNMSRRREALNHVKLNILSKSQMAALRKEQNSSSLRNKESLNRKVTV